MNERNAVIVAEAAAGAFYVDLAHEHGVSPQRIGQIVRKARREPADRPGVVAASGITDDTALDDLPLPLVVRDRLLAFYRLVRKERSPTVRDLRSTPDAELLARRYLAVTPGHVAAARTLVPYREPG